MKRLCLIGILLLATHFQAGAGATTEPLMLEVAPQSIARSSSGPPPEVLLILRNTTNAPWHNVRLTTFPTCYANSKIGATTKPTELAPQGEMFWTITLPPTLPHPIPDALRLQVIYAAGENDKRVDHVLSTSVVVGLLKHETINDVATLTLLSEVENLHDGQEPKLTLSIENKSDTALQIVSVKLLPDSFVNLKSWIDNPVTIDPGHVALVDLKVKVSGQIMPGKHTVGVQVDGKWGSTGQEVSGSSVVTHDFILSVAGATETLNALGVPSLLLLPGYLIVICFMTVAAMGKEQPSLQLWKDIVKPATLIVALTLSFIMVFCYRLFSGRDITIAYGWTDLLWLWLSSISLGGGLGLLPWSWGKLQEAKLRASTERLQMEMAAAAYSNSDTPIDVLKKLGLNDGKWKMPFMESTQENGNSIRLFKLREKYPLTDKFWVISSIEVGNVTTGPEADALEKAIEKPEDISSNDLAALLEKGASNCHWQITWNAGRSPTAVQANSFQERGADAIVEKS